MSSSQASHRRTSVVPNGYSHLCSSLLGDGMRLVFVLVSSVIVAGAVGAQPSAALEKAYDARNAAVRSGNGKAWAQYATDDYSMTIQNGTVITKQQRIAEIEGHPLTAPAATDVRWREYGAAAIETSQVTPQGKPARLIVVWIRQDKSWKVAAAQFTSISTP